MRSVVLVTITTSLVLCAACKSLPTPETAEDEVCSAVSHAIPYLPDGKVKAGAIVVKAGCDAEEASEENDAGASTNAGSQHSDAGSGARSPLEARH